MMIVVHSTSEKSYELVKAIHWALQCAQGIAHLHEIKPPIIHRDIKSPNLLLSCGGNTLKICDFGIACRLRTIMTNNVGSAPWMAPEVFQGTSYTEKCDIYSWGLLLWEIFSRSIPYKDIYKEPYQILWAVCQGTRPPLIPNCPSKIQELYVQCWSKSPNERPSMHEVVKIMTDLFASFSEIHHEDALCPINGAPVIPADRE
ncbi:hypothetical protein PV325_013565 [Microctonus aethiopoides]|nr:hypothetical protein PV325_013565 [Microctonus aethiopoides]